MVIAGELNQYGIVKAHKEAEQRNTDGSGPNFIANFDEYTIYEKSPIRKACMGLVDDVDKPKEPRG